jgi:hypothetical protein
VGQAAAPRPVTQATSGGALPSGQGARLPIRSTSTITLSARQTSPYWVSS